MLSLHQDSRFFILLCCLSVACAIPAHSHNQESSEKKTGGSQARNEHPNAKKEADTLEVVFVGSALSESDKESDDVLSALKKLLNGLGQRNIDQIGSCFSQEVTMFDDRSGKVVSGKEAVLEYIKSKVIGHEGTSPVKRIAVYNPFVRVKGETSMVSFRATKEMADESKLESWCSEVYERKDGQWLVLQFRSNWKPTRSLN